MFDRTKKPTARTFANSESGQALIELTITVVFFLVILLSLEQMVRSYKTAQSQHKRMTYDISRAN